MHKLLISDGMPEVVESLIYALGDHFAIRTCTDGTQLQSLMESFKPDLLVLDTAMPGYDPTTFLKGLRRKRPLILATTFQITDHLISILEDNGVKWLVSKPLTVDTIAAYLLELERQLDPEPELRGAVHKALLSVGVKLRYSGFGQLTEAAMYACKNEKWSASEELYPYVAAVCESTDTATEKSIGRCIRKAFDNGDKVVWQQLFGRRRCPSNAVFIRRIAQIAVTKRE